MPLTDYQAVLAKLLASNRTPDSYLAGGAALHLQPNGVRYSNDLDYFNDSEQRVASAYRDDRELLLANKYAIEPELEQPGYIRAIVTKKKQATKIEWAHDSAWRFLPPIADPRVGYTLHPVDLAVNKLLALVGRDESRDFLDVIHIDATILALGPLCWAAAGKDPGFTPISLLELLRRRGRYQPEDFARLLLARPLDLQATKTQWLSALDETARFIESRPPEEMGCLYYDTTDERFVDPSAKTDHSVVPHFGRPGGVLPRVLSR